MIRITEGVDAETITQFYLEKRQKRGHTAIDKLKRFDEIGRLAATFRGELISTSIILEGHVDEVIADFFNIEKKRRNLFVGAIMKNLDFRRKIRILKQFLRISYQGYESEINEFIDQLDEIRQLRNKLAHAALTNAHKLVVLKKEDTIELAYYEDGKKKLLKMTKKEANETLLQMGSLLGTLVKIQINLTGGELKPDFVFEWIMKPKTKTP